MDLLTSFEVKKKIVKNCLICAQHILMQYETEKNYNDFCNVYN